jgi:hypothetical protein
MRISLLCVAIAIAMAMFETATPAYAELGGPPTWSSSGTDNVTIFAQRQSTASVTYSVNQTTLTSGTVVSEYVAQSGTVFAITWHGPKIAPLNTLLGTYFSAYLQGLSTARATMGGGSGPLSVQQSGLVVQTGGHMGAYTGRAYLPQAFPQGFSADDIQ